MGRVYTLFILPFFFAAPGVRFMETNCMVVRHFVSLNPMSE